MKSRILMATLVVTLMLGVQSFANDCGACDPCNPCDNVSCGKSCDLFSGLKNLLANRPSFSQCGPCDSVVACDPCGESNCDPCGEVGCDPCDPCGKGSFRPFRGLFASWKSNGCGPCDAICGDNDCTPCDDICGPCDGDCGPCDDLGCDPCGREGFSLRKFFSRARGCDPCDAICGDNGCDPCDAVCGDNGCDPCESICDPCGDTGCKKYGSIFDKPRRSIKKFFDGFACGSSCGPCDATCGPCDMSCDPCDVADCGSPIPCSNICPASNDALPPAGN